MHQFVNQKTLLEFFLQKQSQYKIFSKEYLQPILSFFAVVTLTLEPAKFWASILYQTWKTNFKSCKIPEIFHISIFHTTWKTSFCALLTQKPQNEILFKKTLKNP